LKFIKELLDDNCKKLQDFWHSHGGISKENYRIKVDDQF
jgi:hypothetical protein